MSVKNKSEKQPTTVPKKIPTVREKSEWRKEYYMDTGPMNIHKCFEPRFCEALWIILLRSKERVERILKRQNSRHPNGSLGKQPEDTTFTFLGRSLKSNSKLVIQFGVELENTRLKRCRFHYDRKKKGEVTSETYESESEFSIRTSTTTSPEKEVEEVLAAFRDLIKALLRGRIELGYTSDYEELLKVSGAESFPDKSKTISESVDGKVKNEATGDRTDTQTHFEIACHIFSVKLTDIVLEEYKSFKKANDEVVVKPPTTFAELPPRATRQIFNYLNNTDQKSCRLICSEWRTKVQRVMNFGFWLNDLTQEWMVKSDLPLEWLAVGNLQTPLELDPNKLRFVQRALDIVLEVHPDTFCIPTDGDPLKDTPDLIYRGNPGPTVLKSNILTILENANKAISVCFHMWSLTDLTKVDNFAERMKNVCLPNLNAFTALVTSTDDLNALLPIFRKGFPKLKEINVKFHSTRELPIFEQYSALYEFISFHKDLTTLQLVNPPLHPDLESALDAGADMESVVDALLLMKLKELLLMKLKELTLRMLEFPGDSEQWFLPRVILEHAVALETLECEGINMDIVKLGLDASASTLTSFTVIRSFEKGQQSHFFCSDLKNCSKLRSLHIREFSEIFEVLELPTTLTTLEIWSKIGPGLPDIDLKVIGEELTNLESLTVRNEDPLVEPTMMPFLDNMNMKYLCLSEICYNAVMFMAFMFHGISVTTETVPGSEAATIPKSDKPGTGNEGVVPAVEPETRFVIRFDRKIFGEKSLTSDSDFMNNIKELGQTQTARRQRQTKFVHGAESVPPIPRRYL